MSWTSFLNTGQQGFQPKMFIRGERSAGKGLLPLAGELRELIRCEQNYMDVNLVECVYAQLHFLPFLVEIIN